jgi:hypothetical protein
MSERGVLLYDPTAEPRAVAAALAPRLVSLHGTRAGILDNSKANAGAPSPEILAHLTKCDFVLVGSAD